MRVLLFGANGLLGQHFHDALKDTEGVEVTPITRHECDFNEIGQIHEVMELHRPDIAINCVAYTAVDAAEEDSIDCHIINVLGAIELAVACSQYDSKLIHFSTDFVFDGRQRHPYVETDDHNPLNFYGETKSMADKSLLEIYSKNVWIFRLQALFGKGDYFLTELLSNESPVEIVADMLSSPTYAKDVADIISARLHRLPIPGVYHLRSEGTASWYDLAVEARNCAKNSGLVVPVGYDWYAEDYEAERPRYTIMSTEKAKNVGLVLPHWKQSVKKYVLNNFDV
jgi:dTDP-4-dehydrorhamnose reductase